MVTAEQFRAPYRNLKRIIEDDGFRQSDIAKKLNMDRTTFNLKLNRSNGRDFSFEEARKLSEILNRKIDEFF